MKKLTLLAIIATTLAFIACSKKEASPTTEPKAESTATVEQQAAIDASKIDAAPVEGEVAPNPNAPTEAEKTNAPTDDANKTATAEDKK